MLHWNEIRTAATVAKLGTVTAAAEALNVHRATITRHIDTLEGMLGAKLFQRNRRGFISTDLGLRLLQIAEASDEQFEQLHRHAKSQSDIIEGDFTITSIAQMAEHIFPVIAEFSRRHPRIRTQFLATQDLAKLEYGEAHIALRVGKKPQDPDNIVRPAGKMEMGLYASPSYVDRFGLPSCIEDFGRHRFVASNAADPRAPFLHWLAANVPASSIIMTSNDIPALSEAVLCGIGIGFVAKMAASRHAGLIEVLPHLPAWDVDIWLVSHVDINRTPKVRAFVDLMAEPASGWPFR